MKKKYKIALTSFFLISALLGTMFLNHKSDYERYSECARDSAIIAKSDIGVNVAIKGCSYKFRINLSCEPGKPEDACSVPKSLLKNVADCMFLAAQAETNKGARVASTQCEQEIVNYKIDETLKRYNVKINELR